MSDENKVMCHVFMVSYAHPAGFGNFYNYRHIGVAKSRPSETDLREMMKIIEHKHHLRNTVILSVSELQDEMVPVSQLDSHAEKPEQE